MGSQEIIQYGRARQCKDTVGGIKAAFLAPYRKVRRSEYVYDGASLLEFPETFIYKFDLVGPQSFGQDLQRADGGKYFDIKLSLTFNKITVFDNLQFQKLLRKDYFIIIQDRNNNYFLLGFHNGMRAESLKTTTTQYVIDFTGEEMEIVPFVNDLIGVNFLIYDGVNYIFQDDIDFIFQDDFNYIFQ